MCGIIAYSGFRDSKDILLNGLEAIQYRGYDSMGVLVVNKDHQFKRVRSVGDVQQLKQKLALLPKESSGKPLSGYPLSGHQGMAHSRWATHGPVAEKNAHPHKAGPLYLVHNGVIENAEQLKAGLEGPFLSDTDSEVIGHLIRSAQKKFKDLRSAIFDTLSKLKGEYAIALMSEEHPNDIFAFKKGPSLLVGVGEKEIFLCSDAQGILPWTNKMFFLEDGELVHIQKGPTLKFYSHKQTIINKTPTLLEHSPTQSQKEGWPTYMVKEIHEQPACLSKLLNFYITPATAAPDSPLILNTDRDRRIGGDKVGATSVVNRDLVPSLDRDNNWQHFLDQVLKKQRLNIVACGSSYYSALFATYAIEQLSQIWVSADMASEFRYRSPVLKDKPPLLLISQSGETADTLAVLKLAHQHSLPTLSLCNVAHSALDRGAMASLYMQAGPEKAVASTKAWTATLTTLLLIALFLAKKKGLLSAQKEQQWIKDLLKLPHQMKSMLSLEKPYKDVIPILRKASSFIYLGRDIYYPLALEGALKIKELTYRHASAYPAGEMKHGPLALIDKSMAILGIAPSSPVYEKTWLNLEEAHCRGGRLIVIGSEGDKKALSLADGFLPLPYANKYISTILGAVAVQLMAYQTACALGHNVDQPRNLAKSVTVE